MTARPERLVIDTNVLISALLFSRSEPRRCVLTALERGEILSSTATRSELRSVVQRSKFDRYLSLEKRLGAVDSFIAQMHPIEVTSRWQVCRDPADNKFLELAADGGAGAIVSGDRHLLELGSFRGIAVQTAAMYLAQVRAS